MPDPNACIDCAEAACGEDVEACSKSERSCGHHCNHWWSHDSCCWCGVTWTHDGLPDV